MYIDKIKYKGFEKMQTVYLSETVISEGKTIESGTKLLIRSFPCKTTTSYSKSGRSIGPQYFLNCIRDQDNWPVRVEFNQVVKNPNKL